jgi:hypothetical protein
LGRVGSEQADCEPDCNPRSRWCWRTHAAAAAHRRKSTNYIGGSPFGSGSPQLSETLWGKRLVITQAIEALVERFKRTAAAKAMGAGLN